MGDDKTGELEALLARWRAGDQGAFDQLYLLVYDDVRRIAANLLKGERRYRTLQATEIANDVYVRLQKGKPLDAQDRRHLGCLLARAVRNFLIERVRPKHGVEKVSTDSLIDREPNALDQLVQPDEMSTINAALQELEIIDPITAEVYGRHRFGCETLKEIADSLDQPYETVKGTHWRYAKAFIGKALKRTSGRANN